MRQKSFAFQDSYDAVAFLDEIKDSPDYARAKSVLVTLYTDRNSRALSFTSAATAAFTSGKRNAWSCRHFLVSTGKPAAAVPLRKSSTGEKTAAF